MRSSDLERQLRRALQPIDPGDALTERVMAAVRGVAPPRRARGLRLYGPWLSAALAAALAVAVGLAQWAQLERQHERSLAAQTQLLQALGMASEYLGDARTAVRRIEDHEPAP